MATPRKRKTPEEEGGGGGGGEGPAKAAKIAPARRGPVWCAQFTQFRDDYKPRGEDWSTTTVRFFRHLRNAERFLCARLLEVLEGEEYEVPKEWAKPPEAGGEEEATATFREDTPLSVIAEAADDFRSGQYVVQRFDWCLEEVECEDEGEEEEVG